MAYNSNNSNYTYDFDTSVKSANQEKKSPRRIYSTALINQLIKDRQMGYDIDYDPFYMRDLDLRAPGITFRMTEEEMDIYQKCYDDPVWYVENFCKFMTDAGLDTVELRDFQKNVISTVTEETYIPENDDFGPKNRNIIWMAARQSGKTTTVSSFLSWMLVFHPDRNILVVANKEDTAIEIVDKITNIFKGLPYFLKPGCENFGKTGLKLENGSRILSSATTNTASIGFTIHCVLLDEFAHIADNIVANFWRSVYPTLSSSKISQCIITSTPNGTTNKFYDIWSKALEKKNSFVPIRTDYWEVPSHDDEWAAQMRADFGDEEFAQEFELQFNINSRMLLKADDLKFLGYFKREFVHKPIDIDNQYLNDDRLVWHPNFDPNDIDENDKFIFIVDLAEGNGDDSEKFKNKEKAPDYNSINIFKLVLNSPCNMKKYSARSCNVTDAFRYIQVGKFSTNAEDETYAGNVCAALAYDLMRDDVRENVKVMVEMNFNGKSFVQSMQKHPEYSDSTLLRTYHTKPIPGEKQRRRIGFKTTGNKEYYCLKGAKMISMHRIIVTDVDTYTQMQSFGYVKGKLKGIACKDDLSMPVFNHITRMLDEETYVEWLDDILFNHNDVAKKFIINNLIEEFDMENPETSDREFSTMYGTGSSNILGQNNFSQATNPYSEMSLPSLSSIGYSSANAANPYSSGNYGMTYSSLIEK